MSRLGFEHPTFRLQGERSNPLRHRRDWYCTIGLQVTCNTSILCDKLVEIDTVDFDMMIFLIKTGSSFEQWRITTIVTSANDTTIPPPHNKYGEFSRLCDYRWGRCYKGKISYM